MSTTALAPRQETALATVESRGFLIIESFKQAQEVAEYIHKSVLVPDAFRGKPADIVIAMQYGMELGLTPMQALQSVAVVNGRPSLWGDALPGLIIGLPDCEGIDAPEPEGDDEKAWVASCTVRRRGRPPTTRTFSTKDAQTAGLWGGNVWKKYPKRMLMARARAYAIRDAYPDKMKGIITTDEAYELPAIKDVTPSEPRRKSETVPAPATTSSPSAPPASSDATAPTGAASPIAPADVAPSATPAPTPSATSASSSSAEQPQDQVERGVKVTNTQTGKDANGLYYEIETTRGVFHTREKTLHDGAATCEGADPPMAVTWRWGYRKKPTGTGQERVKILLKLALDEEPPAADQGSLLDGGSSNA